MGIYIGVLKDGLHIAKALEAETFMHVWISLSKGSKIMGSARGFIMLLVLSFHLCNPASLHPLGQTLPKVHLQAKTEYKGEQKFLNNAKSDRSIIPHQGRKLLHAMGGGGVTGGQVAGGGNGNDGGSHSNYPQGGGAIPVYAAGAANAHHKSHHSAGSCIHHPQGPSKFSTVLLTYLLLTNPFGF